MQQDGGSQTDNPQNGGCNPAELSPAPVAVLNGNATFLSLLMGFIPWLSQALGKNAGRHLWTILLPLLERYPPIGGRPSVWGVALRDASPRAGGHADVMRLLTSKLDRLVDGEFSRLRWRAGERSTAGRSRVGAVDIILGLVVFCYGGLVTGTPGGGEQPGCATCCGQRRRGGTHFEVFAGSLRLAAARRN